MAERPVVERTREENNFDLLRLLAAMEVVMQHTTSHLELTSVLPVASGLLKYFPGVPVFFCISGFLISKSFESNVRTPWRYAANRALRIFPGLWACFVISVLGCLVLGGISAANLLTAQFWIWVAAQLSFFQFFNPAFLRDYGAGVLNGSLWTIPVEMQFYAIVPVLYKLGAWWGRKTFHLILVAFLLASCSASFIPVEKATLAGKLFGVSFIPHIWYFLMGMLAHRFWGSICRFLTGKAGYWALAHVLLASILSASNPLFGVSLCAMVLSAAHTLPGVSHRLLKGNDISYGIYIYHMPVINAMIALGLLARWHYLCVAITATVLLATLSWRWIEQPALRHKKSLGSFLEYHWGKSASERRDGFASESLSLASASSKKRE